jgi:hypothetical protein
LTKKAKLDFDKKAKLDFDKKAKLDFDKKAKLDFDKKAKLDFDKKAKLDFDKKAKLDVDRKKRKKGHRGTQHLRQCCLKTPPAKKLDKAALTQVQTFHENKKRHPFFGLTKGNK